MDDYLLPSGTRGLAMALALGGLFAAAGCQGRFGAVPTGRGGGGGPGGVAGQPSGGGVGGAGGGAGIVGGTGNVGNVPGTAPPPCDGEPVVTPKRVVRLTFNQIRSSLGSLIDGAIAETIGTKYQLVDATHRTFPPLSNPREGAILTATIWDTTDRIVQDAARYVADNFAAITKCTAATDACAQAFVRDFAGRAFRRPLTDDERGEIDRVYTDAKGIGATVEEAVETSVYAALSSPPFIYRAELGAEAADVPGALTPHELASAIAYFLTDGPPDPPLLDAATRNLLSTPEQLKGHVDRLLASEAARLNLHGAMMGYFSIPGIEQVVIDTGKYREWNVGVRNSMFREAELFLNDVLWNGQLRDLLTSRRAWLNTTLAPFYGVSAAAGATDSVFMPVELPPNRAGILTNGAFLVSRARPNGESVVSRGLLVNAALLCGQNPPFPEDPEIQRRIEEAISTLGDVTEKEKAHYRATTAPCSSCHLAFDAYGLSLSNFDVIARYRTADDLDRPIDASVTLPRAAGGTTVATAAEMAAVLADGGIFAACMATSLLNFALAEITSGIHTNACAVREVTDRFATAEQTFGSLVREVALSRTLAVRIAGGSQ